MPLTGNSLPVWIRRIGPDRKGEFMVEEKNPGYMPPCSPSRTLCLIIKIKETKAAIESQFPHLGGAVGRVYVGVVGGNQVNRYVFAFQLVEKFGEMTE